MKLLALGALVGGVVGEELNLALPAVSQAWADELNSIPKAWTAHVSPRFADVTLGEVKQMCGTIMKGDASYNNPLEDKPRDDSNAYIPAEFNVIEQWPDCADITGHVRDQAACGSCWAFSTTESFEDRRCIKSGIHKELSTQDTAGNCGFFQCFSMGCNGGQPAQAWKWFTTHGVVTGGDQEDVGKGTSCAPYTILDTDKSAAAHKFKKCPESKYTVSYAQDKVLAATSYSLPDINAIQTDMVQFGSAVAAFSVYEDFMSYKSGVYHHVSGKQVGGHAIKMIGWGKDSVDYWKIMNSWGPKWGEAGSFRIVRGENECGIEGQVVAGTAKDESLSVV